MENRKIEFREYQRGHGRLVAENWIDQGCLKCAVDGLEEKLSGMRAAISALSKE